MRKINEGMAVFGGVVIVILIITLLLALPVMLLWNALMPDIFGLPEIGFWQALGLNLLASFLFKSVSTTSK